MLKQSLKVIASVALILISASAYAQSDAVWKKAVDTWEASRNLKAGYCKKLIKAGAKGFSSDYNKADGMLEGIPLYETDGKFRINTVRFVNKGEEYLIDEPKPSKESFWDMMHIRENLLFAKENQQYLTVKKVSKNDAELLEYEVVVAIPGYSESTVRAFIKPNGFPVKVVNSKFKKRKSTKVSGSMTVKYKEEGGKLLVAERLEMAKIEFFGNASYISHLYIFSKYE